MALSRRNAGILVALFLVVGYVFLMFPSYDKQMKGYDVVSIEFVESLPK